MLGKPPTACTLACYGAAPYFLLCSSAYRRKPAFAGFTILIAVSAVDLAWLVDSINRKLSIVPASHRQ